MCACVRVCAWVYVRVRVYMCMCVRGYMCMCACARHSAHIHFMLQAAGVPNAAVQELLKEQRAALLGDAKTAVVSLHNAHSLTHQHAYAHAHAHIHTHIYTRTHMSY